MADLLPAFPADLAHGSFDACPHHTLHVPLA
jgi:hypothetical protein